MLVDMVNSFMVYGRHLPWLLHDNLKGESLDTTST